MTAGDPRKAAVLGVVAVAILGVAVVRIIPRGESGPASNAVAAGAASPDGAGGGGADRALRRNPFYHPGLDAVTERPTDGATPAEPSGTEPLALPPLGGDPFPGTFPGAVRVSPEAAQDAAPAENTGSGQQEKHKRKVVLNAVLEVAGRSLAYVALDGDEFRVGVGDELPGVGPIVSITRKGLVVKTPLGKVTIPVGESVEI